MIKIDLLFTLTSPMNISEAGSSFNYDLTNRRLLDYKPKEEGVETVACQATKKMSILPNGNLSPEGEAAGRVTKLPVIPANTLRGGLRRKAAKVVLDALHAKGEQVSFDLYHIFMCGSSSASPKGAIRFSEVAEAAKNPFVGLFGGGEKMIWSNSRIEDGWPIVPATLGLTVPSRFGEQAMGNQRLTDVQIFTKVDDALRGGSTPHQAISDLAPSLAAWLKTLEESKKRKIEDKKDGRKSKEQPFEKENDTEPEAKDSKKTGLASLLARELVIPGVVFYSKHSLDDDLSGPAMFGLYILALVSFANEQRLGGNTARGFGQFRLVANIVQDNGVTVPLLLRNEAGVYSANLGAEMVSHALEAWKSFSLSAECSAGEFEKHFMAKEKK